MKRILLCCALFMTTPALAINFTDLLKDDVAPKKITYKTVGNEAISLDVFSPTDLKPEEKHQRQSGFMVARGSQVMRRDFSHRPAISPAAGSSG